MTKRPQPATRYAALERKIRRVEDRTRHLLHRLAQALSDGDCVEDYRPSLLQLELDHAAAAGEQAEILDTWLPIPRFGAEDN